MYDNYGQRIYSELVTLNSSFNDFYTDFNNYITFFNTCVSLIIILLFGLGVLKCSDMIHHVLDKTYKD